MRKLILILIIPFSVLNSGVYGSVSGRISDSITQTGISNAYINVIESGKKVISDSDGKYSVFGLPLKKYKVSVTTQGYISQTKEVEVQDSPITILDFSLEKTEKNSEIASNSSTNFGSISGYIRSVNTGEDIIGATVLVMETNEEVNTDFMARYLIVDLLPGKYKIKVTAPGYKEQMKIVEVLSGQSVPMNFFLEETGRYNSQVGSLAESTKQKPDNTYILRNNNDLRLENSNRLPNAFNVFPGVFITDRGNQNLYPEMYYRGTSRLNVNINGIPMNDCFGDYHLLQNQPDILAFTSAAVIQPGGGTLFNDDFPSTGSISIITKRPNPKPGVGICQFFGAGNSFTTAVSGSTGRLGAFSLETGFVTNSTEGLIEKLWNSSMSYYFAADYDNGGAHRFEFTFLGTFQRHANREYSKEVWYWDKQYAKDNGIYVPDNEPGDFGTDYNSEWGKTTFNHKEYYLGTSHDPHSNDYHNSSISYSHTPMASLNWNWKFSDNLSVNNNFYFTLITGGTSFLRYYTTSDGIINFDEMYKLNTDSSRINPNYPNLGKQASSYFYNQAENNNSFGWQGVVRNKFSDNMSVSLLINYSSEVRKPYMEIRDLLGADYIIDYREVPGRTEVPVRAGDKFDYYRQRTLSKLGSGLMGEYKSGDLTLNILGNLYLVNYKNEDILSIPYTIFVNTGSLDYRFLGNAGYEFSQGFSLFAKANYQSNTPDYDGITTNVFNLHDSLDARTALNIDAGFEYKTSYFRTVINLYYFNQSGLTKYTNYFNLENEAIGTEMFIYYKPNDLIELMISGSIAESNYINDLLSWFIFFNNSRLINTKIYDIRTEGAPQKSLSFSGTVFPYKNSYVNLKLNYYTNIYSNKWSIVTMPYQTRISIQSWEIPDYVLIEAHALFDLPVLEFLNISLFANAYNVLNSKYFAISQGVTDVISTPFVIFGLPFSWDLGLRISLF